MTTAKERVWVPLAAAIFGRVARRWRAFEPLERLSELRTWERVLERLTDTERRTLGDMLGVLSQAARLDPNPPNPLPQHRLPQYRAPDGSLRAAGGRS